MKLCAMIATHCICQFWERSEPINMPKTIAPPTKCGVCAVIQFLYFRTSDEECPQVLFFLTIFGRILQLQQRGSWGIFDGKCLIAHHHQPRLGSRWFSSLSSYETVVGGQHLAQSAADQHRELAESTGSWLLWQGNCKIGTKLWKMTMSECQCNFVS